MAKSRLDSKIRPSDVRSDDRLESWKEIATYLNRDVTTVQRWEKREGLPVHRHVHEKKSSVFAYATELDAWMENRGVGTFDEASRSDGSQLRRKPWLIGMGAGALVSIAATLIILFPSSTKETAPTSLSKRSIVVHLFDNLSEDPSLDWLRVGLAEMLVTELSQSPNLRVVSIGRLYQILDEMDRLDEPITSQEVIQAVAQRTNSNIAVLGSSMKSGGRLRVNIRVRDVATADTLATEMVEGMCESSLFPMVDELTSRVRAELDLLLKQRAK